MRHLLASAELPRDFASPEKLIDRLKPDAVQAFPFESELSLYLLLVAALWPSDENRLATAARIFSGAVNFYSSAVNPNAVFTYDGERFRFGSEFSKRKVATFNESFFEELGGLNSLLFTQSANEFHNDLRARTGDLFMMHDVVDYLLKASLLSARLTSTTLAFNAIARNIFERPHGYGVPGGPKRQRSIASVTTPNSVREKWRRAPETVLLSFVMTQMWPVQNFCPVDPKFLPYLTIAARQSPGRAISNLLSLIQVSLRQNRPIQNQSIDEWTRLTERKQFSGYFGGAMMFSQRQLNRLFELSDEIFKKPMSDEQKEEI